MNAQTGSRGTLLNLGARREVSDQHHIPVALPLGKRVGTPLYRWLGGPQRRSGRVRKMSPPGFDPRASIAKQVTIPNTLPRQTSEYST